MLRASQDSFLSKRRFTARRRVVRSTRVARLGGASVRDEFDRVDFHQVGRHLFECGADVAKDLRNLWVARVGGLQLQLGLRLVERGLGSGDEHRGVGRLDGDIEHLAHLVGAVGKRDRVAVSKGFDRVSVVAPKRGSLLLGLDVPERKIGPRSSFG